MNNSNITIPAAGNLTFTPLELEQIRTYLSSSNVGDYDGVYALLTLYLYDLLLTISPTAQFIWTQKFSGGTLIFFVNRYSTLLTLILLIVTIKVDSTPVISCNALLTVMWILQCCVILAQGAFAALRIYAIWGQSLVASLPCVILAFIPAILTMVLFGGRRFSLPTVAGCFALKPPSYTLRVLAIISDSYVLAMTWLKTADVRRLALTAEVDVPITALLLRDGTLHYLLLLSLSIADIVVGSLKATQNDDDLNLFLFVMRSIIVSHFLISLRRVYLGSGGNLTTGSFRETALRFVSSAVGNLGAPLHFGGSEHESDSSVYSAERSNNPLAAGLDLVHEGLSEGDVLLPPSKILDPAQKWTDLFDDAVYGRKVVAMMHRGDTIDIDIVEPDIEAGDPESESLLTQTADPEQ